MDMMSLAYASIMSFNDGKSSGKTGGVTSAKNYIILRP